MFLFESCKKSEIKTVLSIFWTVWGRIIKGSNICFDESFFEMLSESELARSLL